MSGQRKKLIRSPLAVRVGSAVQKLRKQQGVSQEYLAEKSSLSRNYIGNIERGEYDVTVSSLQKVAKGLGCRAADILANADV